MPLDPSPAPILHPRIRTFHPRRSRTTPRAAAALVALIQSHGVSPWQVPPELGTLFQPPRPVILEIGPGMGSATLAIAKAHPELGILAVDVHTPGIGALLAGVAESGLENVRVCIADAQDVMDRTAPNSLHAIHVFFPDPWPKIRHHKRRLVQPDFVARATRLLAPSGRLHLATDVPNYADQMLASCQAEPLLVNAAETADGFLPSPTDRFVTKYELRAQQAGRICRDLIFVKAG